MSMLTQDLPSLPVVTEAMDKPDEIEEEDQIDNNHENDDEVSIDIMLDVLEIPADSIDVPTGNWGHFYDSNTGELSLGMVFKSKDHLKASIQDFSVRHARREYKVVESNPKLWKVCCKWDVETGCNWMLRGIFKSNMGLFKITRYAGLHTCLMNEISVDHGNLGKSMIATHLLGMVRQDPSYEIKNVRQTIKDKFGFEIPYHKAWQALKAARE
ncbi:UNVERIFIED_CONTAM: hypothetical protein Slati_3491500 [Sesamum latifolium]|uniref:Transposase MuDR plant domain-containing protein n=1 Tax=Sesamum latifolium TaxID=2727402 RepID=A0AAW2UKU7_9LAMI